MATEICYDLPYHLTFFNGNRDDLVRVQDLRLPYGWKDISKFFRPTRCVRSIRSVLATEQALCCPVTMTNTLTRISYSGAEPLSKSISLTLTGRYAIRLIFQFGNYQLAASRFMIRARIRFRFVCSCYRPNFCRCTLRRGFEQALASQPHMKMYQQN